MNETSFFFFFIQRKNCQLDTHKKINHLQKLISYAYSEIKNCLQENKLNYETLFVYWLVAVKG